MGILVAYKQVMLRAGLTVEEWISRVFWYCADGAVVMQSTENGVAGLLMQLQRDVLGHSVIVPVHANCHRAHLAFRNAMDSSHEWLDVVGNTMNLVVTWYNNAPTRLRNLRRMSWALEILPLQYSSLGRGGQIDVDVRSKCSSQPSIIAVHDAWGGMRGGERNGGRVSRISAWATSTIVLRFERGRDRSGHLISDA